MQKKPQAKAKKQGRFVSQNDLLSIIQSTKPDLGQKSLDKFKEDFKHISGITYDEYLRIKV